MAPSAFPGAALLLAVLLLVAPGARRLHVAAVAGSWDDVAEVLELGVKTHVFPGAVALVGDRTGVRWARAVGSLTYGLPTPLGNPNAPMAVDTLFDMASCTKVVSTTQAVALLYQKGAFGNLGLQTRVGTLLGGFDANGKEAVTVENCLLHNAGFSPDPVPDFWDPSFGCAGAPLPATLNFGCAQRSFAHLMGQPLAPGATVGGAYVYSDISFLTLMYVVGHVALQGGFVAEGDFLPACGALAGAPGPRYQCAYEAFVRLRVFQPLGMASTQFLPPPGAWGTCAPTTVPTGEPAPARGVALQGRVEDGNAYMLGGIAGHAGLFSNARDLGRLMAELMFANTVMSAETVGLFIKQHNHTQSSRAYVAQLPTRPRPCVPRVPRVPFVEWRGVCGTSVPSRAVQGG